MITETAYRGRSNKITIVIRKNGAPLDFAGATRMLLSLNGYGVIDSELDVAAIDWSEGLGRVVFALGHLEIPPRSYAASLTVFDPEHPEGQLLIHTDDRIGPVGRMTIRIVDLE